MATLAYQKLIGFQSYYQDIQPIKEFNFETEFNKTQTAAVTSIHIKPDNPQKDSYENLRKSIEIINGENSFQQLQTKQIILEEGINNDQNKMKGALPTREMPINQRINSLMLLSRDYLQKQFNTTSIQKNTSQFSEMPLQQDQTNHNQIQQSPNRNPYLVTVTKDFFNQTNDKKLAETQLFHYDHRQLIPKTTFYSSKRDQLNQYKNRLQTTYSENKDELVINQYKMRYKYKYQEKERLEQMIQNQQNMQQKLNPFIHSNQSPSPNTKYVLENSENSTKRVILLKQGNQSSRNKIKKSMQSSLTRSKQYLAIKKESQKLIVKMKPDDFNKASIDSKQSQYKIESALNIQKFNKQDMPTVDTMGLNTNQQSLGEIMEKKQNNFHEDSQVEFQSPKHSKHDLIDIQEQITPEISEVNLVKNYTGFSKNQVLLEKIANLRIDTLNIKKETSQGDNLLFFPTEVDEKIQSNLTNSNQPQSPLRNSKLNEALEKSSKQDSGFPTILPSLVNLSRFS
eukprot:403374246